MDIQNIVINSKKRKLWYIALFLVYLNNIGITEINKLTIEMVSECINIESKRLSKASIHIYKTVLRETLNYLYQQNFISFSGRQAFPLIRKDTRNLLLTTYTKEEISKILNIIDTRTKNGKQAYAIICLLAYYGIRAGDIINFKFEYLDFNKNQINIIQNKTKSKLILPLIDEVKYALIDYIKNGRHESKDTEYLFTTMYAPFTKFNSTSSIHRIVTRIMKLAGVNFENKKHGPHSLRHSLATNMLNENVSISAISSILGHSSTLITEQYITVDTTHLRELSLEVPYAI